MAQRKRNIEFSRPDEPEFLKKLKSKIGYQDNSSESVETKKESLSKAKESDLADREDEQPVFVIDDESKITETELDVLKSQLKAESDVHSDCDSSDATDQKILFKKPNKDKETKPESKGMQLFQSTKKTQLDDKDQTKNNPNIKPIKNTNLLSFDDEDE